MPRYRLTQDVTIKKGAILNAPEPFAREPITYGHAVFDADDGLSSHIAIPLDQAVRDGVVEEVT